MRGMLMFAHNNGLFDYGKMAYASALAAVYHIDESISLVTDEQTWEDLLRDHPRAESVFADPIFIEVDDNNSKSFDLVDGQRTRAKYHNTTRLQAYSLSPYDETLLIDTDVLIQDRTLRNVWDSRAPIRMNREITDMKNETETIRLSDASLTSFWATICYFRKSQTTKEFFSLSELIMNNYDYYSILYGFPSGLIRVDYILTIAAHIMSGGVNERNSLVEPLPTKNTIFAWNRDIMIDVELGRASFLIEHNGQAFPASTYRTVHCVNKDSMLNMADKIIDCYA